MGNQPPSSSGPARSPPRPASPPPPPPRPKSQTQPAALAIADTPKDAAAATTTATATGPGTAPLMPAISIIVSDKSERSLSPPLSISPPLPMQAAAGAGASSPSSLRATPGGFGRGGGSPVPPSPRSVASRASTVTSVAEREAHSYFWGRVKEQYQERKTARRQSQLGTAGKLGRPCCLALHSVSLRGAIPPGAQIHVEVTVLPGGEQPDAHTTTIDSPHPPAASSLPLPPLVTPPRQPVAHGEVDGQGRVDHVLLPSVTAAGALALTVVLRREAEGGGDDSKKGPQPAAVPIATVRYPLAEVTATLRPTELRLTPETHGEDAAASRRARSPSGLLVRSPFGGRRRSESPTPSPTTLASPAPTAAGAAAAPLPTLGAVWGELTFYDNRTSGVGWVEVVEELGKPVNQRRLLLVTPQTLALLDGPAPTLGCPGYPLLHVSHVEPGRSPLARLRDAEEVSPANAGAASASGAAGGFVTVTLSRAEVKAAPGSGHDVVLMVGGEEEARRWTQMLRRAAHEASFGGGDS